MNEHEKLKLICDKIDYKITFDWLYDNERKLFMNRHLCWYHDWSPLSILDVRDIIFTSEFIWKINEYVLKKISKKTNSEEEIVIKVTEYLLWYFSHLDDPVDYLYNLIF
jgi:hypothetical protein